MGNNKELQYSNCQNKECCSNFGLGKMYHIETDVLLLKK